MAAVRSLLHSDAFAFEGRERLHLAVDRCATHSCDFADAMITLENTATGCEYSASFDKALRGLAGVRLL